MLPAYEVTEAARYLRVPYFLLYSWLRPINDLGRPLIVRPNGDRKLSFLNLVEGHVLKALREEHNVPPAEIGYAIQYAESQLGVANLLTSSDLLAGAKQLFIRKFGQIINLGRGGQLAIEKMLDQYLARIEYQGQVPVSFFPFVQHTEHRLIQITPDLSFGKPVLASAGVTTYMIAERFDLGEEKSEIAKDYGVTEEEVEEAIIYEAAA